MAWRQTGGAGAGWHNAGRGERNGFDCEEDGGEVSDGQDDGSGEIQSGDDDQRKGGPHHDQNQHDPEARSL